MGVVELSYDPRAHQAQIHRSLKRFSVLLCHRRFGKTVLCVNELIAAALRSKKERPRFAYISPYYKQSKQVAWDYLKHFCRVIPGSRFNESELRVDLPNGSRITLYGADKYDSLRGIYLDGVVLDEFAQMPPKAWTEVIRPSLSDRMGWAIFIGTPMGHNFFYDLYEDAAGQPDWYRGVFKASETKIIPEDELISARRTMSEDEYQQEYECSFEAAVRGAYYGQQISEAREQNRICKVPYEPRLEVHTAWDLGIDDSTAIIFYQLVGREIRIIDAVEHSGEGIAFYAQLLKDKGYKYGIHNLPHDVEVRELGTGKSRLEVAKALGITPIHVVPAQSVEDGIEAVRTIFPNIWIDDRHHDFVDAVSQYRKEFDDKRQVFRSQPLHDWTSHYADALRMLALSLPKDEQRTVRRPKQVIRGLR